MTHNPRFRKCDYEFETGERCPRPAGHETAHLKAADIQQLKDKYPYLGDDIDEMWMRSGEPYYP